MTKQEQIEEMWKDMNSELEKMPNVQLNTVNCDIRVLKALYNAGYRKTVWHKVADGDLPKYCDVVLVAMHFYNTIVYRLASLHHSEGNGCLEENIFWSIQSDFPKSEEDIIAWTELPEYEEIEK